MHQNRQFFPSLFSFEKTQSRPRRRYGFGFHIFSHFIPSFLWPFRQGIIIPSLQIGNLRHRGEMLLLRLPEVRRGRLGT